ncbi:MAG: hypothetical protein WD401_06980, partial [Thermomicrobiaceae bacterium]
TTLTGEMDMLDLHPYRMPTSILGVIDVLSLERRQVLQDISNTPLDPALKGRLNEIDERLNELWLQRRMELRRTS